MPACSAGRAKLDTRRGGGRKADDLVGGSCALDTVGLTTTQPPLQMVRAYALEAKRALAAVYSASRAALSLQRDIARTKAAYQKEDATSTISGSSFSPVTAADFMVQVLILSSLSQAFPADRFIAEETGAEMLAAGEGTRSAVLAAVAAHSPTPINEAERSRRSISVGRDWTMVGRPKAVGRGCSTRWMVPKAFCAATSLPSLSPSWMAASRS